MCACTHTHTHTHTHSDSILNSSDDDTLHLPLLGVIFVHHHVFCKGPMIPISGKNVEKNQLTCVWQTNSVSIIRDVTMETLSVSDMVVDLNILAWLSHLEHLCQFCCHKSFKIYNDKKLLSSLHNLWQLTTCIYAPMFKFCEREISMYYF